MSQRMLQLLDNIEGALVPDGDDDVTVGSLTSDSLSTENLTLAGEGITAIAEATAGGKLLQHGSLTQSGPKAAADGTWDTYETANASTSFGVAYTSAPSVTHMKEQQFGAELVANITNLSTTGFDIRKVNFSTTDFTGNDNTTYWIAMGEK